MDATVTIVLTKLCVLSSCIECIISEQVEKLKVTLREIKCLTSAAHNTASLIENIMESEVRQLAECTIRVVHCGCYRMNWQRMAVLLMQSQLIMFRCYKEGKNLQQTVKLITIKDLKD